MKRKLDAAAKGGVNKKAQSSKPNARKKTILVDLPPISSSGLFSQRQFIDGLKNKTFRKITFLVGAGISVAAGIPDFRSPKTGLYAQVKAMGLPIPEDIFNLECFLEDPHPFYTIAKQFLMYQAQPVLAHLFMKKLFDMKCLHMVYTQNIDSLELDAGIPIKKIIQAHGHMRSAHCCKCKMAVEIQIFYDNVLQDMIGYCHQCHPDRHPVNTLIPDIIEAQVKSPPSCSSDALDTTTLDQPEATETVPAVEEEEEKEKETEDTSIKDTTHPSRLQRASKTTAFTSYASYFADQSPSDKNKNKKKHSTTITPTIGLIKPDIIFFGEKLPNLCISKLIVSDIIIVMGTSLKVKPFSELIKHIPETVPIIVINRDLPKVIQDDHPNHLFLPGDIQETIQSIIQEIGWSIEEVQQQSR